MNAEQMWNNYIKEHSESKGSTFEAWHFGSNKELANELASLVKNGDKTLNYWRQVHKNVLTEELKEYNKSFHENMKVVCEEFKVIWK